MEVPAVLEGPAVAQILLDSIYYTIRTSVFYVVLFSPPPDKCLKLGPRHFFPPTFEFTAYYNPHIQRHTVKTTDVIKQATNKLPHA